MKKFVSVLVATAILLTGVTACSGGGKTHTAVLSPENTGVQFDNGVSVELGDFVLRGESELTVSTLPVEDHSDEGYKIAPYDFKLEQGDEFSDFVTLRIPFDASYSGEDLEPADSVGVKHRNEATGEWEDVLFEVDAAANEVIIYTTHFSTFGIFHVKNEGARNAKITNIYADITGLEQSRAVEALQEFVDSGGVGGNEAVSLGAELITGYNGFLGGVGVVADGLDFGIEETILSIASLGNPTFDSALGSQLHKTLGKVGKVASVVKLGSVMLNFDKTEAETLNLYKDAASIALSFADSARWGLAASGLVIFDYTIQSLFEEGMALKREKVNEVYVFFNDKFVSQDNNFEWEARGMKDWRQVLIDIAEENPDPQVAQAAIREEVDRYANVFWTLGDTEMAAVITDMKEKTDKGSVTIPVLTKAEIASVVASYKADLYERLHPVAKSVAVYMQRKAEAEYLASLGEVRDFFNQSVTFKIVKDVPEGEEPKYDGYALRFAPLSSTAVKESWSGVMKGSGGVSTKFTLLGYLQAGMPNELQLFKPGDDPDSAAPELSVGFKISVPVTEVKLGGLDIEKLLGTYLISFTGNMGDDVDLHFTFKHQEGQLIFLADNPEFGSAFLLPPGPYEYDPAIGTAVTDLDLSDGDSISAEVNFVSKNGSVHLSSHTTLIYEGKKFYSTGQGEKVS